MSIRLKLLLSYAAMLVIPLVSILLLSLLMVIFFRGGLQNIQGIYKMTQEQFDKESLEQIANEIKRSIRRQPDLLMDLSYLDEIAKELQRNNADMAVRVNDSVVYHSPNIPLTLRDSLDLSAFKWKEAFTQYPVKRMGNSDYLYMQLDFKYHNNDRGSVFIMTKIDPISYFIRQFFPTLFVALLCMLVVTHILLTTFMSKSIIRPLQALRDAAREIKEGNLDFRLQVKGQDEIGQLGIAFEEMRSRLLQSIRVQLQYEENRKELIANISHDLRTPLTAIKGYIDGIMDGIADTPEKNVKYLRTIAVKADEMDHLIQELFLYSKLDLNRQPFQFETVNVVPFLRDWTEELQFELEKRSIAFHADIQLEPRTAVSLDRDHFKRVLGNIIQNSVRYMDKAEPELRLTACREGDKAIIMIADNGIGIEPEALPHIFERFYRADESRNTHTGGSGLGLAIAKQIMDAHGGVIAASSESGAGTSIKLSLPIMTRDG
ncbi:HAMP domain-containing sensor histidine kinase [Paenibacillus sp. R14(2021)]|uniref:sensor histidine kinase n=1 Tax=Paenibacillus sp. R14(2021) TaxID=2859228 RepID=UPI001C611F25|nr:HAMP domain-containing sensor histidine kinase [Paenibacillus sp. R14(2021)]